MKRARKKNSGSNLRALREREYKYKSDMVELGYDPDSFAENDTDVPAKPDSHTDTASAYDTSFAENGTASGEDNPGADNIADSDTSPQNAESNGEKEENTADVTAASDDNAELTDENTPSQDGTAYADNGISDGDEATGVEAEEKPDGEDGYYDEDEAFTAYPKKPRKKLLIFSISLLTVVALFFVSMGFGSFFGTVVNEEEITQDYMVPVDKATGKINILILGVDKEGLRTDTIIVASYDLDTNKVNILSIPRDTRMYVGSRYQKINSAHAISQSGKIKGPQGTIEAVTRLTGIPINYYVEFSFNAFKNTIDALGGVDFDVPRNMYYKDPVQDLLIDLDQGFQHLDGDKAEQLVRFRMYPEGDIARVETQQAFIKAVAEQKLNLDIITKLPELYEVLKNDIKTNFTILDITKYVNNLKELSADNIQMYHLPGQFSGPEYKASYWIVNMSELKTLIQTVFEYDTSDITIHSADGSSASKDRPDNSTPKATAKSTQSSATKKPSASPSASPSGNPSASKQPSQSKAPQSDSGLRPTVKPTSKPDTATVKPTESEKTQAPTKKPETIKTESPTKKPESSKTEAPTKKPARPTPKPTPGADEE